MLPLEFASAGSRFFEQLSKRRHFPVLTRPPTSLTSTVGAMPVRGTCRQPREEKVSPRQELETLERRPG